MLERLTSVALRAPGRMVAAWAVVLVAGVVAAGALFSSLDADLDGSPGFESEQVADRLAALDPGGGDVVAIVEGAPVGSSVIAGLEARDGVEAVHVLPGGGGPPTGTDPPADPTAVPPAGTVSAPAGAGAATEPTGGEEGAGAASRVGDGEATEVTGVVVELDGGMGEDAHERLVDAVVGELRSIEAPSVLVGGEMLLDEEVAELSERDAQRAEALSLPAALVVMAVVFGGVLAAGLPLALALGGMSAAMAVLVGVAALTDVSLYALNVTLMLGMGLGIDYGLLMITRFREERAAGWDGPEAVRRTVATAGRTVVFSAATVAAALVGLLVFEDPTVRSLGIAGIVVVLACMVAALTLFPALLGRVGHRLRRPAARPGEGGLHFRLAGLIQRRALPVVVVVGVGLALLAAPFADARFDDLGVEALPRSSETRRVAEAMEERFPGVTAEPVVVVADAGPDDPAVGPWLDRLAALEGVDEVTVSDASTGGTTVVEARPQGQANGPVAQRLVTDIRGLDTPFPAAVGGDPAEIVDFRGSVADRLPLAVAVIVVATFVLLFLMTGSVVVPAKAIVMNVLSLGATLGAMVWVFQDGHLSGLLAFDAPGSLDLVMPVVVFVFAFGLSMDYEVFLLARIREAWEETGDNDRAVAVGLQRSGRIITSAALLMVIVFAGFVAGEIVALKQLGLGLALAVAVDATVVRSLLVPATMKLMGRRNWWAPAPLVRLHARIGLREAPPTPDPHSRMPA